MSQLADFKPKPWLLCRRFFDDVLRLLLLLEEEDDDEDGDDDEEEERLRFFFLSCVFSLPALSGDLLWPIPKKNQQHKSTQKRWLNINRSRDAASATSEVNRLICFRLRNNVRLLFPPGGATKHLLMVPSSYFNTFSDTGTSFERVHNDGGSTILLR